MREIRCRHDRAKATCITCNIQPKLSIYTGPDPDPFNPKDFVLEPMSRRRGNRPYNVCPECWERHQKGLGPKVIHPHPTCADRLLHRPPPMPD